MSYYDGFAPYVSVAEKKAKADKQIAKLKKKNPDLAPILLEGRTIAKSWWGKAWNTNLESYADYANRIDRGKSYVRNHAVLDLQILPGKVKGLVQGTSSKPYQIEISIDELNQKRWKNLTALCNHRISSLEELAAGKFPGSWNSCSPSVPTACFPPRRKSIFPAPAPTMPICASMWRPFCTASAPGLMRILFCFLRCGTWI